MGTNANRVTIEALLAHQDWLRRLASALVRDANEADDLVQETMLAALRTPPKSDVNTRNWLAIVLRNTLRTLKRSDKRRGFRERVAARKEALPATVEALARASMQHEIVEHVLSLDEEMREVVLLRFFADMPPREIAKELDRPLVAVKNSLQRGLAQLRLRLDAKHGGREEWLAALLPFVGSSPLTTATKVWTGAALLLLISGAAWFALTVGRGTSESSLASVATPLAAPEERGGVSLASTPTSESNDKLDAAQRTNAAATTEPRVAAERRTPETEPMRVRFVDLEGAPLAGFRARIVDTQRPRWSDASETVIIGENFWLEVSSAERQRLRSSPDALAQFVATNFADAAVGRALILGLPIPDRTLVADGNGESSSDLPWGREQIYPEDPTRFAYVGSGRTHRDRLATQRTHVFAPARALRGRLVDADGQPVRGARVAPQFVRDFELELPFELSDTSGLKRTSTTDDDGRFVMPSVARVSIGGFSVEVGKHTLLLPESLTVEQLDVDREWVVTLHASAQGLLGEKAPTLIGRVLRADGSPASHARVASTGQFADTDSEGEFELAVSPGAELWAFERGYGYARLASAADARRSADGKSIEIVLDTSTGSIEGIVLDEHGLPARQVEITVSDPTRAYAREPIEAYLVGARNVRAISDDSGRFKIEGLLQREYRLRAARGAQCSEEITASPSNARVTLALPLVESFASIRGRVLTLRGEPIAEPRVSIVSRGGGRASGTEGTVQMRTSIVGEFELRDIAGARPALQVTASGYMSHTEPLESSAPDTYFEIRLAAACRIRADVPGAQPGDQLCVHDATNSELEIVVLKTGQSLSRSRLTADLGTFPPFQVSELATEIVILRGEQVIARRPVVLDPDRMNHIEF